MSGDSHDFVPVATVGRPFGLTGACALFVIGQTLQNLDYPAKLWASFDKNAENLREIVLLGISGEGAGNLRCTFEGVSNRDEADLMKNQTLFIERNRLPKLSQDEYYFRDLVGLAVKNETGEVLGTVKEVFNYPTTDALDVRLNDGRTITVAFKKEIVKEVSLEKREITVDSETISELMF